MHGRHHRRVFTGESSYTAPTAETQAAAAAAVNHAFSCIHQGTLITPTEALMLAGAGAREKETLYSIACKYSREDDVDLRDVLSELGHRFPDYA